MMFLIIGDWNAKVGSQEIPEVTGKFGLGIQNKAGQRLLEFCQENALVIANTLFQQHKRRLYCQYQKQIDYILCSQIWRSSIQSAKTRLRADCGLDHELLIAKCCVKMLYCMFAFTFIIFVLSLMIPCFSLHLSCYFLTSQDGWLAHFLPFFFLLKILFY